MKIFRFFVILILSLFLNIEIFGNEREIGPYLQSVTPNQITILWETKEPTIGKIIYGLEKDQLTLSAEEKNSAKLHQITLTELKPNQRYFYSCQWDDLTTPVHRFKTAPLNSETPIRIAVVGDSRSNPDIFKKIVEQIQNVNPDILLHTGDLVASGKRIEQWKPQFFEPSKQLIATTPLFPVLGNHEEKASYYYHHFTIHQQKPWWSADYGSVHLIGLNTSEDGSPGSEQYKWLIKDLEANQDKKWRIVLFHNPLFHVHPSRPVYDIRYFWQPLFNQYNVNFVLTGHDHYYLRTYPVGTMSEKQHGTIHIITAGGGAPLYKGVDKEYTAFFRRAYHFLSLDVTENEIIGHTIDENGVTFDAFILHKDQIASPQNFIEFEMYELEQRLKSALGNVTPVLLQGDEILFDTNVVVKTNFSAPVSGQFRWENSHGWLFNPPKMDTVTIAPGQSLVFPVSAKVLASNMYPSPTFTLKLNADNASSPKSSRKSNPVNRGFRNQEIRISLEEAAFGRAISVMAEDMGPLFYYLKYFSASERSDYAVFQLGRLINKNVNEETLAQFNTFLNSNLSAENKFRLYPFSFLFGDFSRWDKWLALVETYYTEKFSVPQNLMAKVARLDELNTHHVNSWWIIGPFDNENGRGFETAYSPENKVRLNKSVKGLTGQEVAWQETPLNRKHFLDLKSSFSVNEHVVGYAFKSFQASKAGKVLLLLGSDDGAVVWVNGKELYRKDVGRSARPCQDIIPATLKKGKNDILVKVAQSTGSWGLYLQIMDKDRIVENSKL